MLYYSSARFFFLQLGKCVHICRPRVVPLCTAGVPTGWDGNGVAKCSSGSLDPWWDALQRAQLMPEFRSGRVGSLVVKNMTIGIEASHTTTTRMGTDWPVNRLMHVSRRASMNQSRKTPIATRIFNRGEVTGLPSRCRLSSTFRC
jgi:hypothetical protein